MTVSAQHKREARIRRHRRVRKKVEGSAERPRLAVFRSNKHISAQVIDDRSGKNKTQEPIANLHPSWSCLTFKSSLSAFCPLA